MQKSQAFLLGFFSLKNYRFINPSLQHTLSILLSTSGSRASL